MWGYINDCNERGLQPTTIRKRLSVLSQFGKWCNKQYKVKYVISPPTDFKVTSKKEIIFLNRNEVNKLLEFNEFNINNSIHKKHLTHNHKEIEYIIDKTKSVKNNFQVKYTSYEVYKDMLLFLCGTGMRYGDMVNLKIGDYNFKDEDRTKGSFSFYMEKTKDKVTIPIEGYVHDIWKKYSKNKYSSLHFFPLTKFGNTVSVQKFNTHIKEICRIVGLNRRVKKPKFNVHCKIIPDTDVKIPLWETVTSHIGRRTFIREHIELKTPERVIMKMTGQRSREVFDVYYDVLESDIEGRNVKMYQDNTLTNQSTPQKDSLDTPELEEKLKKLKSLYERGPYWELPKNR